MVLPAYRPLGMARCSKCGGSHRVQRTPDGRFIAEACGTNAPVVKRPDAGLANESELASRMTDAGLVGWEPQFYFATSERTPTGKPRLWHSDFAFPKAMLLVEVEGQVHSIKAQRAEDCLRASTAAALGYRMVRVTRNMVLDAGPQGAVALIRRALCYDGRTAPLVATRPTTSEDRA